MNIDKKSLNKLLHETLSTQYEIDKFLKNKAKEKGIEPGYHIIYTAPENGVLSQSFSVNQEVPTSWPLYKARA